MQKKLNLLSIVSYRVFPAKLGGQKGIALFNEYLARHCNLICVTVKDNDPQYAIGYKLLNVLSNSPLRYINLFYFFKLRKIIKQEQVTHLLLEHPYYGWLGMLLKGLTGVRLIIHSHNIETTRWQSLGKWWWRILSMYEKMVHHAADYNFFIQDDDREYAVKTFGLQEEKCTSITYGIEWDSPPLPEERFRCKQVLQQQHNISAGTNIFLFNGTLDYAPNLQAVTIILEKINPLLLQSSLSYKIIICGKGLPASLNELKEYAGSNIIYAGFVDDITLYFKGSDIFLNPVTDGGGIKTKLVEAIGYNTPAVSTKNGSTGVTKEDAGDLLRVTDDGDWQGFVQEITKTVAAGITTTPASFYNKFYWGNITNKAISFISR
jgi:polysaccharide biosynthesis protein PslH